MMRVHSTPLAGLILVEGTPIGDERGSFERLFCDEELAAIRPGLRIVQVNLSTTSARGTLRGLHYQHPPAAEAKLIRCLRGSVFDIAVDLRTGSPSYLRWHAIELAEGNASAVFIPEGFAHGFQTLSDDVQILYMHTTPWMPACEAGVRYNDPRLAITWPLPVRQVSMRDQGFPFIDAGFHGIQL